MIRSIEFLFSIIIWNISIFVINSNDSDIFLWRLAIVMLHTHLPNYKYALQVSIELSIHGTDGMKRIAPSIVSDVLYPILDVHFDLSFIIGWFIDSQWMCATSVSMPVLLQFLFAIQKWVRLEKSEVRNGPGCCFCFNVGLNVGLFVPLIQISKMTKKLNERKKS